MSPKTSREQQSRQWPESVLKQGKARRRPRGGFTPWRDPYRGHRCQQFDGVGDGWEAVFARYPVGPAFDCGFGDFKGVPALAANQVMMVVVFLAVAAPVPVTAALADACLGKTRLTVHALGEVNNDPYWSAPQRHPEPAST